MKVHELLSVGKEYALSSAALMNALNVTRRELYAEVARERKSGLIILSDYSGGYYIPDPVTEEGQEEIAQFKRRMESMADNITAAANGRPIKSEKG